MLPAEVLNIFNNNSVLPHTLYLAVCSMLGSLSKNNPLVNNTRAKFLRILTFWIRVETLRGSVKNSYS